MSFLRLRAPCVGVLALLIPLMAAHFAHADDGPVMIDWAKGDLQTTDASCAEFLFKNMRDHHGYVLWVTGKAYGVCSFQAKGLTFHYPPNYGPTTQDTKTLFYFQRFGSEVAVTWQPGY